MDPYSNDGELSIINAAFHQYQYESVLADFDPSAFSPDNHLPARILQLRARVALGQADDVLADIKGDKQPELVAVSALALAAKPGKADEAVAIVEKLLADGGDAAAENALVQVLGGTVLAGAGKAEEALALLGRHQGNREFVGRMRRRNTVEGDTLTLGVWTWCSRCRCFDRADTPPAEPK